MRTVLQRVTRASVSVSGEVVGHLPGPGLVALVAAGLDDGPGDVATTARKIADLRVMPGELSIQETGGGVLVISQFTLYGQTSKGRRPSWGRAAPGEVAQPLVDAVVAALVERGVMVQTGVFGADMQVELVNDGPFTVIVDT